MINDNKEYQQQITDAVEHVISVATQRYHDSLSEETFIECHVCGGFDEHKENCFIPALEEWLKK